MKTFFTTLSLFLICCASQGQKYDQQWPFGYGTIQERSFGISMLDFNSDKVELSYHMPANKPSRLGSNGSFICDKEGQFILGTDNCRIFDSKMITIEGGDNMNPGPNNDERCDDGRYPSYQCSLILPEITNDSVYYVVHEDSELDFILQDLYTRNLYLSIVVKRSDGSLYVKEKKTLLKESLNSGKLTALLDPKENKWWMIFTGYDSNLYYKLKIGGLEQSEQPLEQSIGPVQNTEDAWNFQSAFSPDGTIYALNNSIHGLMLFDFDIETGEFSNYRNIPFPNMEQHRGISFSPNSKYVYVTTAENLYQIGVATEEVIHIAQHWESGEDGWPVGLGFLHIGPDCRIYVSPSTTNFYLHTILYPNRKGKKCELALRAFRTPTNVDYSIPNLPMYRFNGSCDSTIQFTGISSSIDIPSLEPQISIYPNPTSDFISIEKSIHFRNYTISNIHGQIVAKGSEKDKIDISFLPAGIYFLQVYKEQGNFGSGKFIKL